MMRDPLCSTCRTKMDKSLPSLKVYLEDALADKLVSDTTKLDIRQWMKANEYLLDPDDTKPFGLDTDQ